MAKKVKPNKPHSDFPRTLRVNGNVREGDSQGQVFFETCHDPGGTVPQFNEPLGALPCQRLLDVYLAVLRIPVARVLAHARVSSLVTLPWSAESPPVARQHTSRPAADWSEVLHSRSACACTREGFFPGDVAVVGRELYRCSPTHLSSCCGLVGGCAA